MTTAVSAIVCKACENPLPIAVENSGQLISCATCAAPARIDFFPQIKPKPAPEDPQLLVAEDQATCYFHGQYQAEVPCDSCGRFLCRLCDIPFQAGHHCISCIEQMQKESNPLLISSEVRWTNIAMVLLLLSFPLWFFSVITIPAALVIFFKFARKKKKVLPMSTRETVLFVFVALGTIVTTAALWISVVAAILAA